MVGGTVLIHRSLWKPCAFAGSQREAVVAVWALAAVLVLPGQWNWVSIGVAALLAGVAHGVLVLLFRWDPDFIPVIWRHLKQQGYYPALARPDTTAPKVRPCVPTPKDLRRADAL